MPDKAPAITEESLRIFLNAFYAEVKKDPLLAPIFVDSIGSNDADWAPHMGHVQAFWESQFLGKTNYHGEMKSIHNAIPNLEREHFKKWMEIFLRVVPDYFETGPTCDLMIRAQNIMKSLHNAYWDFHDKPRHPKHLSDGSGS